MSPTSAYDYVIVGAGSAGCVLAHRLTTDPAVRVLLLEAGGSDTSPLIQVPIGLGKIWERRLFDWGYDTEPEPRLDNRQIEAMRGKVLGGSSSINAMIYARGHPLDYDAWRQKGLAGWGYADVLPYFKRSEHSWRGDDGYHGTGGLLTISPANRRSPMHAMFVEAAAKQGYPESADYNGAEPEGIAWPDFTIARGRRNSTARAFLRPARKRANLTVATRALAHRVILRNGRAVAIEYRRGGETLTVEAGR
jgi:4-pyridoxate dehydrogenase